MKTKTTKTSTTQPQLSSEEMDMQQRLAGSVEYGRTQLTAVERRRAGRDRSTYASVSAMARADAKSVNRETAGMDAMGDASRERDRVLAIAARTTPICSGCKRPMNVSRDYYVTASEWHAAGWADLCMVCTQTRSAKAGL